MSFLAPVPTSTRQQAFASALGVVLFLAACAALFWAGLTNQDNSVTWVWPLFCVPTFVLSFPNAQAWLERGRRRAPGIWRTARATRLGALFALPVLAAWQFDLVRLTLSQWRDGDLPRAAVAGGVALPTAVFLVLGLRNLRAVRELTIDAQGIDARAWRGRVSWSAIAEVSASETNDAALIVKLEPLAMAQLPRPLRTVGFVALLPVARAGLTTQAALEAMAAVRPDLVVARPRSGGLVLPVRGATDIVEADL